MHSVALTLTLATVLMLVAEARHLEYQTAADVLGRIDHVVYAAPDLKVGIDRVEQLCGVRATPGGQHPGRGTRNALLRLGPATYLEIIGPDPDQAKPATGRPFGIDDLAAPRVAAWAAKESDLDTVVAEAALRGVKLGQVVPGSRQRQDGVVLTWRYTDPRTVVADGIVPFFIAWGETPHPAGTAAAGLTLVELRAEHPEPERVQKILDGLGIALPVRAGSQPALIATVSGPRGRVELR